MNVKYKQIIVIAIASIMIFSGFLILISQSSSPIEKMSISPFIQNSFNPIENVNYSLLSGYTDINIFNGYIIYYYSGN